MAYLPTLLMLALASGTFADGVRLSADVANRHSVVGEPIAVCVQLHNGTPDTVAVVPPYAACSSHPAGDWPLTLTVRDADGDDVPNVWRHAGGEDADVPLGNP